MTPMLKKAARAAYRAHEEVNPHGQDDAEGWAYIARAVLLAIREPDENMVIAALSREEDIVGTYGCAEPTGQFTDDGPSICFTAMIDTVLTTDAKTDDSEPPQ